MLQQVIVNFDASSKTFTSIVYIVFGILVFSFAVVGMLSSSGNEG